MRSCATPAVMARRASATNRLPTSTWTPAGVRAGGPCGLLQRPRRDRVIGDVDDGSDAPHRRGHPVSTAPTGRGRWCPTSLLGRQGRRRVGAAVSPRSAPRAAAIRWRVSVAVTNPAHCARRARRPTPGRRPHPLGRGRLSERASVPGDRIALWRLRWTLGQPAKAWFGHDVHDDAYGQHRTGRPCLGGVGAVVVLYDLLEQPQPNPLCESTTPTPSGHRPRRTPGGAAQDGAALAGRVRAL
jgi:hypothetical protein